MSISITAMPLQLSKLTKRVLTRGLMAGLIVFSTSLAAQNNASRSTEIDVSPDFKFRTFHSVTLDLSVSDNQGLGLEGEVIRVYAVEEGISSVSDPKLASRELILMTRTDAVGRVYLPFELSHGITNLMFEIGRHGVNNKVLYTYEGQEVISHNFSE